MKKQTFTMSLLLAALVFGSGNVFADNNVTDTIKSKKCTKPAIERPERPKLYDKSGNEIKGRPEPGVKVYDKNGNELKRPERPKLYDKNGNEIKGRPEPGVKVYDKNGNELKRPERPKGPELNLTEAQKKQADKIRENSRKKLKPIFTQMKATKNQIDITKENTTLTKEAKAETINKLETQLKTLHQKADKIRLEDMKKFESLLTSEQKVTLEQFKKEHKPRERVFNRNRQHGMHSEK